MIKKLYYGAAYYPELWSEEVVRQDIEEMKKAGINAVRMGEFAWSRMEPEQDNIDVGYFAGIVERLYQNGIGTVMCTPTPAPPIWMSHQHPERMHVNSEGVVMSHGARQHVCTNNPFMRERSRIIVEAVASALGNHPGVIAWQLDNEFKCHVAECMCRTCLQLWHQWLERKYGTIGKLNDAWGTQVWSEAYQSFEQVPQPVPTPFIHNSSLSTMYKLFSMDKIAEFAGEQIRIIRSHSAAPITHNVTIGFSLDNELMFKDLDFASLDDYPCSEDYNRMLFDYSVMRNVKAGRSFWVMETSASHNGYLNGGRKAHPEGYLTAEALAAFAGGAEAFCYWPWRQQRAGCEQLHSAVLSSWGKPSVGYRDVIKTGDMIRGIEEIMANTLPVKPKLAVTFSDRARVFFSVEPMGTSAIHGEFEDGVRYIPYMEEWHRMLLGRGIGADWIFEGASLEGYRILMTPFIPCVSDEYLARAVEFVRGGGIWIAGPLTGYRTKEHTAHTDAGLGQLDEYAGVETKYLYPIGKTGAAGHAFGVEAELFQLAAVLQPKDAEATGIIHGGAADGEAFITERKLGKGTIVLIGAMPKGEKGTEMLQRLVGHYALRAGLAASPRSSPGTVVIPREGEGGYYWFVINMDGGGGCVTVPVACADAQSGGHVDAGTLSMERYEYRILQFARPM